MSTALMPSVIETTAIDLQISGGVVAIRAAMDTLKSIRTFVAEEMVEGLDFGAIPGTGIKKVMLLPGAQKVAMYFNAWPDYEIEPHELGNGHVEYLVITKLLHRRTGQVIGSGIGSCSSMEGKYRYRNAQRACPACGKSSIIQTKKGRNPGGYWCVPDKGGCGANFNAGDKSVEGQETGKVENENIHDQRNTVLKMAKKRSTVDASIALGCLAEMFTQDLDDTFDISAPTAEPEPEKKTARDEGRDQVNKDFQPEAKQGPTFDKIFQHAINAWHKFDPDPDGKESVSRQHRVVHDLISSAIADGHVVEHKISKPAQAGKPLKRDPDKVWDAARWLYDEKPAYVTTAIKSYLDKKRAELEPKPTSAPSNPQQPTATDSDVLGGSELLAWVDEAGTNCDRDIAAFLKAWGNAHGLERVPIKKWSEDEAEEAYAAAAEMLKKLGFDVNGNKITRQPGQEG